MCVRYIYAIFHFMPFNTFPYAISSYIVVHTHMLFRCDRLDAASKSWIYHEQKWQMASDDRPPFRKKVLMQYHSIDLDGCSREIRDARHPCMSKINGEYFSGSKAMMDNEGIQSSHKCSLQCELNTSRTIFFLISTKF